MMITITIRDTNASKIITLRRILRSLSSPNPPSIVTHVNHKIRDVDIINARERIPDRGKKTIEVGSPLHPSITHLT